MKKDIIIPVVKDVHLAVVKEWNADFSSHDWIIYLINNLKEPLESVMIMSRGKHRDGRKTSTFRHAFKVVPAKSSIKVELIMENVFPFMNEFVLTYFLGSTLYDKTFMAPPHSIAESNLRDLPVMDVQGVLLD
ncbi:hypothetical protein SAMN05192588_2435 [Nonlabens sp. Hel1_33_55]|mgnify:CR=1 FL=1|uniref:hypothetical protein n=1 Tax=Nonlabens sp. Hel1_33_55 TaxID=1336802 RepID=UPI000875AC30|nr:hypothetical protein [Nonlabens sp. Hel1_33_55]SCY35300.1 hypothetical protein SAMN05192588_2435 [Nonlabens sp. Hel1_33_55]